MPADKCMETGNRLLNQVDAGSGRQGEAFGAELPGPGIEARTVGSVQEHIEKDEPRNDKPL